MTPTAVSQIIEQIFRVITMVLFASLFLPLGLDYAAAGASLGAFAGAIGGLFVLVYYQWKLNRDIELEYGMHLAPPPGEKPVPVVKIIRRIFSLALPVSAASIMLPIVSNLDLLIVPQRLEVAGYNGTAGDGTLWLSYGHGCAARKSRNDSYSVARCKHCACNF